MLWSIFGGRGYTVANFTQGLQNLCKKNLFNEKLALLNKLFISFFYIYL